VGSTEDAGRRLGQHNRGRVASTRGRGPWEMVYSEEHPTRWEATRRERCLKAAKSRRLLLELVEGPGG
jgi:putative endonuclease